jgi:hypothetical protein
VEFPPALLPTGRDVRLDGVREGRPNRGRSGPVGVSGQLEPAVEIAFLEPDWKEVDKGGACDLDLGRRDLDRDPPEPAQRKTLFSLSKKPSSSR